MKTQMLLAFYMCAAVVLCSEEAKEKSTAKRGVFGLGYGGYGPGFGVPAPILSGPSLSALPVLALPDPSASLHQQQSLALAAKYLAKTQAAQALSYAAPNPADIAAAISNAKEAAAQASLAQHNAAAAKEAAIVHQRIAAAKEAAALQALQRSEAAHAAAEAIQRSEQAAATAAAIQKSAAASAAAAAKAAATAAIPPAPVVAPTYVAHKKIEYAPWG